MSSPAGWYPDPGGSPGGYRYWDGRQWSAEVSTTPSGRAEPAGPSEPSGRGVPPTSTTGGARRSDTLVLGPSRSGSSRWWLVGLGALLLVVAVVVVLIVRAQSSGLVDLPGQPGGTSTRELCPLGAQETPPPGGGERVVSGQLSYPRLGAPFAAPTSDNRVPYGHGIRSQVAQVEARPDGTLLWVAQIVIAQLSAGDGFYGVEQGSHIVADCVAGLFYADVRVERTDRRDEAIRIDGRNGWIVEAHLTFAVPGIKTTGETMIIIVVETDDGAGLFYGSLPDTSPQYNEMIRAAMADLRVG